MFWIFAIAIIMRIDNGLCASTDGSVSDTTVRAPVNLTAITWAHAVNGQAKLKKALNSSKLGMMDYFHF